MKLHLLRVFLFVTIVALICGSVPILCAGEKGDPDMTDTDTVGGGGSGGDTPTGLSGSFGGSIQTGAGSFDPYERNASRTVTDIVVPGAVVPFTFTRIWNSRSSSDWNLFPNGWRHNWDWEIFQLTADDPQADPDNVVRLFRGFQISYPDGRSVRFWRPTATSDYGAVGYYPPDKLSIKDIFHVDDALHAHLTQTDGTTVTFDLSGSPGIAEKVTGVIDPYLRKVTISVTNQGMLITEPAQRWINIGAVQGPPGSNQTMTVTTSLGQSVSYVFHPAVRGSIVGRGGDQDNANVFEGELTVTYNNVLDAGNQPVQAQYVYKQVGKVKYGTDANNPSVPNPPGFYRLVWASDPMFEGPMTKVKYAYVDGPYAANGDSELTAVIEERYASNYYQTTGQIDPGVTSMRVEMPSYTNALSEEYWTRKEIRDNGTAVRSISYFNPTHGYGQNLIDHFTDFTNNPAVTERHEYDWTHLFQTPTSITDMRGKLTQQALDPVLGHVTRETHPDTKWFGWTYDNPMAPYYVQTTTDENSRITTYRRDANHRVWRIEYPDTSFEEFTYNDFGQVLTHTMKGTAADPGGIETYTYDPRGLKKSYIPPATEDDPSPATHPTYYYYDSLDRLSQETDPRGNSTWYQYNGRHQITRITHQDLSYIENGYNTDGTLAWTTDENHMGSTTARTIYTYDEYKRVTSIKDPNGHTTTKSYDRWDSTGRTQIANSHLDHTDDFVFHESSGAGVVTDQDRDVNLRLAWKRVGTGGYTYDGLLEEATTRYHYDAVGNLDWVQDPRGYTTFYGYDDRNRKNTMTPPAEFAAQVTTWEYDPTGDLVTKESRPDGTFRQLEYDSMNRLWKEHQPRKLGGADLITTYLYFPSGMLESVQDANLHTTHFTYDKRNRKATMKYPDGQTVGNWNYDLANNLISRPTADPTQTQTFHYDNRNRIDQMRWSNGIDFANFGYDFANHLTSAVNPYSTITRFYDDAGRMYLDRQALAATLNAPTALVTPLQVVSRKAHPGAGTFDVNLPLTGDIGIESRSGGLSNDYTVVLTFAGPVTTGGANVISGVGRVSQIASSGNVVTVSLTGVSNAQRLYLKVFGINNGAQVGEVTVPMHILVGDVNADGRENVGDTNIARAQVGAPIDGSNFRADANCDGSINSGDLGMIKGGSGMSVPSSPSLQVDVSYARDKDGRMTRLYVYAPGEHPETPDANHYDYSYRYDALGRLEKIYPSFDPPNPDPYYRYYYDFSSNVSQRKHYHDGTAQFFDYDALNRVGERRLYALYWDPAGHTYEFSKEHYTYDPMSRLVMTERTLHSPDTTAELRADAFGYNDNGELTAAAYDYVPNGQGGYVNPARSVTYTLDPVGNRNLVQDSASVTVGFTPNALNQYLETPNGSEHEIATAYGVSYRYLGDTRLAAVSSSTVAGQYELGYDALGRCVQRSTGGVPVYYVFDGEHAILEYDASGVLTARSLYGRGVDELIIRENNGGMQHFFQDRNGNTSAVTDSGGQVIEQYRYDAFGRPEFRSGPQPGNPRGTIVNNNTTGINNRFLFTGREWVQNYGFYEYRARAYNPALGRFMSEDPLGIQTRGVKPSAGGFPNIAPGQVPKEFANSEANLFDYCHNDPINKSDPFGLEDFRLELIKTGDRNQHVPEIIGQNGNKLSGETKAEFKVHPGEKQQDGATKVKGEMKVDVKYADSAGPKTRAETARLEPDHAKAFDKWFDRAQKTVEGLNRQKFDSSAAAEKAMEGSLRRSFNETRTETHRLDVPKIFGGTGEHLLPYKYNE